MCAFPLFTAVGLRVFTANVRWFFGALSGALNAEITLLFYDESIFLLR